MKTDREGEENALSDVWILLRSQTHWTEDQSICLPNLSRNPYKPHFQITVIMTSGTGKGQQSPWSQVTFSHLDEEW